MTKSVCAVIKTELRRRKVYISLWGLGLVVLSAFTVLAYAAVKSQANELNKAFASFGSNTGSFFGTSDMFSPTGYLNSQLFYITLPILFIILGVTLSSALTRKEEQHKTLELLLARPISRSRLLLAKIITADVIFAILGCLTLVTILICSQIAGLNASIGYVTLTTVLMVLFSGAFGAIAFMLYVASQRTRRAAAAITILLSLGGYIVTSIAGLVSGLAWLAKIFPYHYYDPGALLRGQVSWGFIIYTAGLYIVALVVSLIGFRRRDIS